MPKTDHTNQMRKIAYFTDSKLDNEIAFAQGIGYSVSLAEVDAFPEAAIWERLLLGEKMLRLTRTPENL